MRTLVVGTVPPPGGAGAQALAAVIAERASAGDVVEVLSPDPRSASHHQGALGGLLLPFRLALASPRFDAVELRIEAGLPLSPTTGRLARAVTMATLGAVLRLYSEVTIRLDSPVPIPGGLGGRATQDLWSRATRIVVQSSGDRDKLLLAPGVSADRVEIAMAPASEVAGVPEAWPSSEEPDLRGRVLARVRQRAAEERRANSARVDLGSPAAGPVGATAFSSSTRVTPNATAFAHAVASRGMRKVRAARRTR